MESHGRRWVRCAEFAQKEDPACTIAARQNYIASPPTLRLIKVRPSPNVLIGGKLSSRGPVQHWLDGTRLLSNYVFKDAPFWKWG